ncbi:MAG: hypothetical protein MSH30_04000 [Campylobacter sp.]|nr:hypothetical protein [Campylobacter sp.]
MSKDKSKKWVISAPLFYNYAGILEFLSKIIAKSRIPKKIIANSRIPRQKHLGILDFAKPKHRLFAKKLGVIFAQVFYHS